MTSKWQIETLRSIAEECRREADPEDIVADSYTVPMGRAYALDAIANELDKEAETNG